MNTFFTGAEALASRYWSSLIDSNSAKCCYARFASIKLTLLAFTPIALASLFATFLAVAVSGVCGSALTNEPFRRCKVTVLKLAATADKGAL